MSDTHLYQTMSHRGQLTPAPGSPESLKARLTGQRL